MTSLSSIFPIYSSYVFHSSMRGVELGLLYGVGIGYLSALFEYLKGVGNRPFSTRLIWINMRKTVYIFGLAALGIAHLKIFREKEIMEVILNRNTKDDSTNIVTLFGMMVGSIFKRNESGCLMGGLLGFVLSTLFIVADNIRIEFAKKLGY